MALAAREFVRPRPLGVAVEPRLIVCDEPTSGLDVPVQAQILNLLRELQRELGASALFITHNIGVVECVAEAVAVIHRGRSVETGPVSKVLGHSQEPHTRSLPASVPKPPVLARRSLSGFVACDQQSGS